ncbi:MAG TPA: molecular chaperone TorD family protein [Rhodocyclaceae bacterium]|nr:molecular chaperone TorD family protein [Rhodocyclaceae bacterium]
MSALLAAIAEDAEALAALHDRELTPAMIAALREADFPRCLALLPRTEKAAGAWRAMAAAVAQLPAPDDALALDDLAAEYAAIYLTGAYGASPCESMWTDDDGLNCQAAMFEWRALHDAIGLATPDWRQRPDDHLVLQLLHIAASARRPTSTDFGDELIRVLDDHVLRWLPQFAARVAGRSASGFYAALAVLTAEWAWSARAAIARP